MNGLFLNIEISADDNNALAEALQAMIDDLGQGNRSHANANDDWFYKYALTGKEITA
jgi:hypothetical protein